MKIYFRFLSHLDLRNLKPSNLDELSLDIMDYLPIKQGKQALGGVWEISEPKIGTQYFSAF